MDRPDDEQRGQGGRDRGLARGPAGFRPPDPRGEAGLILGLIARLRARGDLAIAMIVHNYAQTLDVADRIVLMQRGRITYESDAARRRCRS